jgi:hypothetical protein
MIRKTIEKIKERIIERIRERRIINLVIIIVESEEVLEILERVL